MNNFKRFLFVFLFFAVKISSAQKTLFFEKNLSAKITSYYSANLDNFIKMTYPKVFKTFHNVDTLKSFNLIKKTGFKTAEESIEITKLSDIIYIGEEKFCRIYFKRIWKIPGITDLSLDQAWELIGKYGMDYVIPDQKEKWFEIIISQSILVISPKDSEKYTFLEINNENKNTLKEILPEEVFQKMGYEEE